MKKVFIYLAILLPSLLAQAQNQPQAFKSLVDLGVCHGQTAVVARFLDGDRLKLQQSADDLEAADRWCAKVSESATKNTYICGADSWGVHHHEDWDLTIYVDKVRRSAQIINTDDTSIFYSSSCTPHNGWTLVK